MKNEADKRLHDLTRKLLSKLPQEKPSPGFTNDVMAQITALAQTKETIHKPLISNQIWLVIAILVGSVFSYLIFGEVKMKNSFMSYLSQNSLLEFNVFKIPDYGISNVLLYAVTGFTFFMGVQIYLLRGHFNRRYS